MLNLRHLETMIITADAGSFRKAAERMYVTPSAIIKQIDALEEETGTVLFDRTSRGLQLTAAGHSLYTDGKLLLEYAEKSVARARSSADDESNVLRVATSPVTSADLITDYWVRIYEQWPQLKIQIIPFQNTPSDISRVFAGLGSEIDMLTGICDKIHYSYRNCSGTALMDVKVKIAVSRRHPFAHRTDITPQDLKGSDILLISPDRIQAMDSIRRYLKEEIKDVRIHDFDHLDMQVFNDCEKKGWLLVTSEQWAKAHPMLSIVDVSWQFTIPYGILHSVFPSEKVKEFLSLIVKE
ncbi:MAG: LysR family transcriptional regulator [Erysipelotrichaceae bacterium]|nr:LysR family transcriptional regulator [Erysipelotrichaceae bacterium]